MKKLVRKLKSKFMHWHRWSPKNDVLDGWGVKCKCGVGIGQEQKIHFDEKIAKRIAWEHNVNSGNAKANYINNGVLKLQPKP